MVKKYDEIEHVIIPNMKGGTGDVERIPSVVAGEYDSDAKVVTRLILRPGVSIGGHVHEEDEEIMTILSGTATYIEGDREVILTAGDVTVCRKGEFHSVANRSETEDLEIFAVVIQV